MFSFTSGIVLILLPGLAVSQSPPNPTPVACPSDVALVRTVGSPDNQTVSPAERSYISARATDVLPAAWQTYLENVNAVSSSAPLPSYVASLLANSSNGTYPNLGIAVSGGGYRAALFGAGVLSSLDARNTTSAKQKGTGGPLQAASYLSGLSGGSWLVTALAQANFPTIADLIFPPPDVSGSENSVYGGFLAQVDLTAPGPTPNDTLAYLQILIAESKAKHESSGLPITITDPWSRALARHFVNGTTEQNILLNGTHGAGILLSDIPKLPSFIAHAQPFPIITVNAIPPQPNVSTLIPGNSVPLSSEIWEFNVFESGSYDPALASFIPTSLLGSTNSSNCIAGFDQAFYIAGISSNLFNSFNISESALQASPIGPLISLVRSVFPSEGVRLDSAAVPNPFKGVNPSTYSSTDETFLALVDGGSNGEVIPLHPLLVRARGVDTIIAIDASADTKENFSNGTDLINTAKRATLFAPQYPFPSVPATADNFIQQGLTQRPTFFGCNDSTETPLVIYIANGAPSADGSASVTNTSTLKTAYTNQEVQAFLDQAFLISTQGINGTDSQWGTCLACAVVDRARARQGIQREGVCESCLARYCWNGEGEAVGGNVTTSAGSAAASGGGGQNKNGAGRAAGAMFGLRAGLFALLVGLGYLV